MLGNVEAKNSLIRWKVFYVTLLLISAAGWYYTTTELDESIRLHLEDALTSARGSAVSIQAFSLSIANATFELNQVEVGRRSDPERNLLTIDKVSGKFDWMLLLRKKLRISDITCEGIRHNNKRTHPAPHTLVEVDGEQIPWTNEDADESGASRSEISQGLYSNFRKTLSRNPIQYLSELKSNSTFSDKVILNSTELKSLAELKRLMEAASELEKKWEPTAHQMSDLSSIELLQQRWTKLKQSSPRVLASKDRSPEALALATEIRSRFDEIDQKHEEYEKDLKPIASVVLNLDSIIDQDVPPLREKLGFPKLDIEDLTGILMGPKFLDYFERYLSAISWSRVLMPTGTHAIVQQRRSEGTSIHFASPSAPPTVLIDKISIYSKLGIAQDGGDVQGTIEGLTSDPSIHKIPFRLKVTADFPSKHISQGSLELVIDHTGSTPKESIAISAHEFPLHDWILSNSPLLKLSVQEAILNGFFKAELSGDNVSAHGMATINQTHFDVKSSIESLQNRLDDAIQALLTFDIKTELSGKLSEPTIELHSDFGKVVSTQVLGAFRDEIKSLDESIKRKLRLALQTEHEKLIEFYRDLQRKITPVLERRLRRLQELQSETDKILKRS